MEKVWFPWVHRAQRKRETKGIDRCPILVADLRRCANRRWHIDTAGEECGRCQILTEKRGALYNFLAGKKDCSGRTAASPELRAPLCSWCLLSPDLRKGEGSQSEEEGFVTAQQ
ncbi:hypothetical protein MRB53_008287 [Persea americana]|uniref:Uncharacterized protein n=1 Tax=Persea americana TaxID=3435 RepID=A0ACC2MLC3_PERAE|nr:hypothetical protein MRB53_008287 [Persea americana]